MGSEMCIRDSVLRGRVAAAEDALLGSRLVSFSPRPEPERRPRRRTLDPVPLPADVVALYANATMAITGFEVDLLRKTANGSLESVSALDSYNHHYSAQIYSSALEVTGSHNFGHHTVLDFDQVRDAPPGARLAQALTHGNGQEHRQIFHGAPPGYVLFSVVTPRRASRGLGIVSPRRAPGKFLRRPPRRPRRPSPSGRPRTSR